MKNLFSVFIFFYMLSGFCAAASRLQVEALGDFNSVFPADIFTVKLVEDGQLYDIPMIKNDILTCELKSVKNPARAKQDAKIYYVLKSYEDSEGIHDFKDIFVAKYAKTTLKENRAKIAKRAVLTAGSVYVKGLSYGVSFVEGIKDNEEDNRIKSGFKKMYDDSFFSLVEYGEHVEINKGDRFYLIVKRIAPDIDCNSENKFRDEIDSGIIKEDEITKNEVEIFENGGF